MQAEEIAFFLLALEPREASAILLLAALELKRHGPVADLLEALVLAQASDPQRAISGRRACEYRLAGRLGGERLSRWRRQSAPASRAWLVEVADCLIQVAKMASLDGLAVHEGPPRCLGEPPQAPKTTPLESFQQSLDPNPQEENPLPAERILILTTYLLQLHLRGTLSLDEALKTLRIPA